MRSVNPQGSFLLIALLFAGGCSAGGSAAPSGSGTAAITFHKHVEPLLQQHCQGCHSPGHIAPFSLVSYADVKAVASLVVAQTRARTMPPFGAASTADCRPRFGWQDDNRLSDAEIELVASWAASGAAEGSPADAPPPFSPPPDGLPGVQQTVEPRTPFVAGGSSDQFQCFVIDPGFTQARYLNGWHFVAGNPRVVHHALMFVTTDAGAAAQAVAKGGAHGSYPCFGGPEVSARLLGAWAPGAVPAELPPTVATTVAAGSVLVMQVHYHPAGLEQQTDSTRFQMRFAEAAPKWQLVTSLIGNFSSYDAASGDGLQPDPATGEVAFRIPANDGSKVIDQVFTLPPRVLGIPLPELRLLSIGAHMHYVGRDMRISVERGATVAGADPKSECLLETPAWNFNWQRGYAYATDLDSLPRLHGGDKLRMRCVYDNSMKNPFVVTALEQQHLSTPRDVYLGETTLDEMCLGVFGTILSL